MIKRTPILLMVVFLIVSAVFSGACSTAKTTLPAVTSPATTAQPAINLTAAGMSFNLGNISVSAGAKVTINFNNQDTGIQHNFALYTDSTASKSIFVGQMVTGPGMVTYTFTAPSTPGNYFFRCDVHPTVMIGTFTVT